MVYVGNCCLSKTLLLVETPTLVFDHINLCCVISTDLWFARQLFSKPSCWSCMVGADITDQVFPFFKKEDYNFEAHMSDFGKKARYKTKLM